MEVLCNLPKVIEPVSGRVRFWTQVVWLQNPCSYEYIMLLTFKILRFQMKIRVSILINSISIYWVLIICQTSLETRGSPGMLELCYCFLSWGQPEGVQLSLPSFDEVTRLGSIHSLVYLNESCNRSHLLLLTWDIGKENRSQPKYQAERQ